MNRIGVYRKKNSHLCFLVDSHWLLQVKNSCCFSYWGLWKWNGMKCVCPPLWPQRERKNKKRYVNIKLHIPVHRITAYQLIYEVGMKNMSDKTSEQNYWSALLKQKGKCSKLGFVHLGVETDVKSNEREKDLHHPLSLRDGAQQSERSIQAKRCGASRKASVIVLITSDHWVGSETYGKLTALCFLWRSVHHFTGLLSEQWPCWGRSQRPCAHTCS